MATEFVLHVVSINAQRSLSVITQRAGVSFSLLFWKELRADGQRSDGKCVAGPVSIPPKKKFFKLAFPNGSAVESWP